MPAEPSVPAPERITPIARLPHSSASERRKRSMGMCTPGPCARGASLSTPCALFRSLFAGITYTQLASTGISSAASRTAMVVDRARISLSRLWCLGSRCCTNTMARPVSAGKSASRCLKTSSPPADPPMPATGMLVVPFAAGSGVSSDWSGTRWSSIVFRFKGTTNLNPSPDRGNRGQTGLPANFRQKAPEIHGSLVSPRRAPSVLSRFGGTERAAYPAGQTRVCERLLPVFLRHHCQRGQLDGLQFAIQCGKLRLGQRRELVDDVLQLAGQSAGARELRFGGAPFIIAHVAVEPRHELAQALFARNGAALLGGDNLGANHIGRIGELREFAAERVSRGEFRGEFRGALARAIAHPQDGIHRPAHVIQQRANLVDQIELRFTVRHGELGARVQGHGELRGVDRSVERRG